MGSHFRQNNPYAGQLSVCIFPYCSVIQIRVGSYYRKLVKANIGSLLLTKIPFLLPGIYFLLDSRISICTNVRTCISRNVQSIMLCKTCQQNCSVNTISEIGYKPFVGVTYDENCTLAKETVVPTWYVASLRSLKQIFCFRTWAQLLFCIIVSNITSLYFLSLFFPFLNSFFPFLIFLLYSFPSVILFHFLLFSLSFWAFLTHLPSIDRRMLLLRK